MNDSYRVRNRVRSESRRDCLHGFEPAPRQTRRWSSCARAPGYRTPKGAGIDSIGQVPEDARYQKSATRDGSEPDDKFLQHLSLVGLAPALVEFLSTCCGKSSP